MANTYTGQTGCVACPPFPLCRRSTLCRRSVQCTQLFHRAGWWRAASEQGIDASKYIGRTRARIGRTRVCNLRARIGRT